MIMQPMNKYPKESTGDQAEVASKIFLTISIPVLNGVVVKSCPPIPLPMFFNPFIKFIDHTS